MDLEMRVALLQGFPCFAALSANNAAELAMLMSEVSYKAHDVIVTEDELIDSVYIIVSGEAEVTRMMPHGKKIVLVPVAILHPGEAIGLNDTGFYSSTGKRTATVTALTAMLLLRLDLKDLYEYLKKNNLESSMSAASLQMLRMRFIKQSLPFTKLPPERLRWLAERVEEMKVKAGTVLFRQGDIGDSCYFIRAGEVEIVSDEDGIAHRLAVLKPPVLFGEATLITHSPRNATARALTACELLVLRHEYLSELIESEQNVANMFMTLMVDRSRPLKNPIVSIHKRNSVEGEELTILKNPSNGHYFKLSKEGAFIWDQLNGQHTIQEITLDLADQFKVFAPEVVAALISKLTQGGFIRNLEMLNEKQQSKQPYWVQAMLRIRNLLEMRKAFGDADPLITKIYQRFIRYFFTRTGQFILAILAITGLLAFIVNTDNVLLFFSVEHAGLLLILGLVPLSLLEVVLHELGHAFAVKAFGREVHYLGVGWYWVAPVAFTDTSDMWLSQRRPRMLVNLAGVYIDVIVAGISSLLIFIIGNPYIQGMLWLFALYTYIGAFRMMSPLQEMDGYYVLMDWLEKNRLRESAVLWLMKVFPKSLRHPGLFRKHKAEVGYWLACILFLILVTMLTFVVQDFVLTIFDIHSNRYVSLLLPFVVVVFSSLGILADLRNQAES